MFCSHPSSRFWWVYGKQMLPRDADLSEPRPSLSAISKALALRSSNCKITSRSSSPLLAVQLLWKTWAHKENISSSTLPHGIERWIITKFFLTTAAALNLQNRWQWVKDLILLVEDWKPFLSLSSLVVVVSLVTLKFRSKISVAISKKKKKTKKVVEFMGPKPRRNLFTFSF